MFRLVIGKLNQNERRTLIAAILFFQINMKAGIGNLWHGHANLLSEPTNAPIITDGEVSCTPQSFLQVGSADLGNPALILKIVITHAVDNERNIYP
ncbi:hypothetical protein D3C81_1511570 [compost metagenome]